MATFLQASQQPPTPHAKTKRRRIPRTKLPTSAMRPKTLRAPRCGTSESVFLTPPPLPRWPQCSPQDPWSRSRATPQAHARQARSTQLRPAIRPRAGTAPVCFCLYCTLSAAAFSTCNSSAQLSGRQSYYLQDCISVLLFRARGPDARLPRYCVCACACLHSAGYCTNTFDCDAACAAAHGSDYECADNAANKSQCQSKDSKALVGLLCPVYDAPCAHAPTHTTTTTRNAHVLRLCTEPEHQPCLPYPWQCAWASVSGRANARGNGPIVCWCDCTQTQFCTLTN